jgi:hypothetical protein
VQSQLLDQGIAQFGVVIDNQDRPFTGHRLPDPIERSADTHSSCREVEHSGIKEQA